MTIPRSLSKMKLHHLKIFLTMKILILRKIMKEHLFFNHMVSVLVKLQLQYHTRNAGTNPLVGQLGIEDILMTKADGTEVLKLVERKVAIPTANVQQIIDLLEGTTGNILRAKTLQTQVLVTMIMKSTSMIFL